MNFTLYSSKKHWTNMPRVNTTVIGFYYQNLGNGKKFLKTNKFVKEKKNVILPAIFLKTKLNISQCV